MPLTIPPEVKEILNVLDQAAGPVFQTVRRAVGEGVGQLWTLLATGKTAPTLGNSFRNILVVGLNRAELLAASETQPVQNENWQDLIDDTMRRSLGMVFFAPRGLDGNPVNPYLFLAGEEFNVQPEDENTSAVTLSQQLLGGLALLDFCRMPHAAPNTVNILLAGDTLFHWDMKDNYVLPTSSTNWVRDVEQVLKTYPRTTKAHIYTAWDTDLLHPTDRITVHALKDLPLDESVWINKPTTQEKYGGHVLAISLLLALLMWAGLSWQKSRVNALNDQLHIIEQQIPREGRFTDLQKAIAEQEKFFATRDLFFLTLKDTARSIQNAGLKAANFEVKMPDPQNPPTQLLVTVEAEKNAYKGWLEEEPIAKAFLLGSATIDAVRKPPGNNYKIEGLVNLPPLLKQYKKLAGNGSLISRGTTVASATTKVSLTLPQGMGGQSFAEGDAE